MTNLIITSPRPNQLVSGAGEVTWVDLDGSEAYHVEIDLGGTKRCYTLSGQSSRLEVNWDDLPWCNSAKIRVKRTLDDLGAEASPIIIPRHLPPVPKMVCPSNGNEAWSEVVVCWKPVMNHDVDNLPFRALVQARQVNDWVTVKECRPDDDMAIVDVRQFGDGPLVLRVSFENEAGLTSSSEATINVHRQGALHVDVNPPRADVAHSVTGGKITFSLDGEDVGSGISMLRMKQDEEEWGEWLPFSPSFEINAKEDGISRFFFQFVDHAGNMTESSTRLFREIYHNATVCAKVGKEVVAACDSLVISLGRNVVSLPGRITCLGSYKGMAIACVEGDSGSSLVQASDPPVVIWTIPEGKVTHMTESCGVLYLGCDNGNVFSFYGGTGFLTYVAKEITFMGVLNGSLVVGCAKQGLICFNGTTWEKI
jgi:hypothetical protein